MNFDGVVEGHKEEVGGSGEVIKRDSLMRWSLGIWRLSRKESRETTVWGWVVNGGGAEREGWPGECWTG